MTPKTQVKNSRFMTTPQTKFQYHMTNTHLWINILMEVELVIKAINNMKLLMPLDQTQMMVEINITLINVDLITTMVMSMMMIVTEHIVFKFKKLNEPK